MRYFTKSGYKVACECPTKLYYTYNKEYGSKKIDNPFLEALAYGGFQVGALARQYYQGGHFVETLHREEAIKETKELLKQDEVTIFEAAINYNDLLIRVDILKKIGNHFDLIEVKSKSFVPSIESPFYNSTYLKKGIYKLVSSWKPYLYDVAFQKYVLQKAFPNSHISSFLYLADKSKVATVDGLNQKFFLKNKECKVIVDKNLKKENLGDEILIKVKVDDEIDLIIRGEDDVPSRKERGDKSFEEEINYWAKMHLENKKISTEIGKKCKGCEFRIDDEKMGLKSGFEECWSNILNFDHKKALVFDVWDIKSAQELISSKKYFASDIRKEDIFPVPRKDGGGLSRTERQWLQIVKEKENTPFIDIDGLKSESKSWRFPLHFIDFETTMVAIPFNKGRHPYEQIAFQFSHHAIEQDGSIEHRGQYINTERGKFPNFDFLRALKKELEKDNGTIFRYGAHENTVLCQIWEQLQDSPEKDKNELCKFIESITKYKKEKEVLWEGPRNMVDMLDLVKRYYYSPQMGGSNSIKQVLPAVLNESKYLQDKYSLPIYGSSEMLSHNFKAFQWIQMDDEGKVKDPYKLLPRVFKDIPNEMLDQMLCDEIIADGGAAMIAYAKMQFTEMSDEEVKLVTNALLKYCELDTLAMVMIWEYWNNMVNTSVQKKRHFG